MGATVAAVSLFLCWTALGWGGERVTQAVSDLGVAGAALVATVACWRRARSGRTPVRWGWVLLAGAGALWLTGEILWSFYEVVLGRDVPFPSVADVAYLGAVPLAAAALLVFPGASTRGARRLRNLLDASIIAGSLLFVSWALVLGPTWRSGEGGLLAQVIALAYPVSDVVMATLVLVVVTRAAPADRAPLLLLSAGLLGMAVADSGFAYLTNQDEYASGAFIDVGWFAGYLLIALAAVHPRAATVGRRPVSSEAVEGRASVLVPYVPLGIAATVGALRGAVQDQPLGPFLAWTGAAVVTLALARQLVALLDNLSLTARLRRTLEEVRLREHQLRHQALHDGLTGLANRALFWDRLEHAVARGKRGAEGLTVLYLDLDGFKTINDDLGHMAGDQLLSAVAERLRACVRPSETVARLGGDEFAVLLEGVDDRTPDVVVERISESLSTPFVLGTRRTTVAASIGVATWTDGPVRAEDLVREADEAMYRVKAAKKRAAGGQPVAPAPVAHEKATAPRAAPAPGVRALT